MTEIKFGPEDVGKWAVDVVGRKWVKIDYFSKFTNPYPVITSDNEEYTVDGKSYANDKHPHLLPATHPAVLAGKLEIPIPPPPRKKVVLEPGRYYVRPGGSLAKTERPIGERVEHFGRSSEVFEITEPVTLVEGEE